MVLIAQGLSLNSVNIGQKGGLLRITRKEYYQEDKREYNSEVRSGSFTKSDHLFLLDTLSGVLYSPKYLFHSNECGTDFDWL